MSFDSSAQVRRHLVRALRADLAGPFAGDEAEGAPGAAAGATEEVWDLAPSKRYLCGFLVPHEQARVEDEEDEDPSGEEALEAGNDPGEESQNDPQAKRRPMLPSSIGLSVLLPPSQGDAVADRVTVRVRYADYVAETQEPAPKGDDAGEGKERRGRPPARWRRIARPPVDVQLDLDPAALAKGTPVGHSGLRVFGQLERTGDDVEGLAEGLAGSLPPGTRALSVFVVNDRPPVADQGRRDEGYVFQVSLALRHERGLVPRPDLAGQAATDWDDQVMDLQFRDQQSYATGHGIAVAPIIEKGRVVGARTEWIPEATVKRVTTRDIEGVEVAMDRLGELDSADAVRAALSGIPAQYGAWLEEERKRLAALGDRRQEVAEQVLFRAERARDRIREGIELLAGNPEARKAFCIANQAMAMAARQRSPARYEHDAPAWRLFQLAFVLLSLPAVADPAHDDRETVELIFFPTGGGKTEAYLGVIAFTLIWRRMTGAARPDQGLGVAVILRYTLRLLTLDQLGRAATLICALDMLRRGQPALGLGALRFSLGLWVGKSATANRLSEVARQITDYRNGSSSLSPFPLAACPWCRKELTAGCMKVMPSQKSPVEVEVGCADFGCAFSPRHGGLPVLFVDEQIYRELPSFLVATVDKLALLPWRGESGALFGQVRRRVGRMFVGPCTPLPQGSKAGKAAAKGKAPETAVELPEGLRPPELIVQDELHLISGPLGTMVGLYETAIEELACHRRADGAVIRPKIIASTATVKRALQQVQALYGRDDLAMFPPPGIDDGESYFAQVDQQANGRLYVGVAAAGRSAKAVLVTVYAALLAAAQKHIDAAGQPGQPGDPYMTLVGYFNNLRELGGMRRLVEDLIRVRAANRGDLKPLGIEENPWMANRELDKQPIELTSRESTSAIARSKDLLGKRFLEDGFIPTVLASNMISVGVDIERLGLMVVAGQPKSTSEYIQATSRVGRDDARPGLVVTCYNLNKPRDRSYYEHFQDYHASFYRHVEATSVTEDVDEVASGLRILAQRVLDRWSTFIADARAGGAQRCYSPYDVDRAGVPMLHTALDEKRAQDQGMSDRNRFVAPTSMRDVEPTVHLWLEPAGWSFGGGRR